MAVEFKSICHGMRDEIKEFGTSLLMLKCHVVFDEDEKYVGQHGEMKANIMLAYRHLEDARMRIGKILQAADDGISILDKPPITGGRVG